MFDWVIWLEDEVKALWAHIRHHKANGTTPNGSVVAPVPAPAAPAAPAPDAPPVFTTEPGAPTPSPVASAIVANGMTLVVDGSIASVKLDLIEQEIATNPIWANACHSYVVSDMLNAFSGVLNPAERQFVIDACATATVKGSESPLGLGQFVNDGRDAYEITPPGGILALPQDFTLAKLPAWIAGCNAAHAAAVARGETGVQLEGYLPIIDHSHRGPVAH